MINVFPIEFVRKILLKQLLMNHKTNSYNVGGDNLINIFSFYEQLRTQEQVDRYVEMYRDLTNQQNRAELIANGVIATPSNPTITNVYGSTIIPLEWTCSLRVALKDRDQMIYTISSLIESLKGRKVDCALLNCRDENGKVYYEPFMVGTIGNNKSGGLTLRNGDFIDTSSVTDVPSLISAYQLLGVTTNITNTSWFYLNTLGVVRYKNGTWSVVTSDEDDIGIVFPPTFNGYTRYKVSMSFESIRCDEPRTLNGDEYCDISFGGSATIVDEKVKLGNDLVKISIQKNKIVGNPDITINGTTYYLEPLEMPSSNDASTQANQLMSNYFKQNTHTDSVTNTLQYTFVVDETNELIAQMFDYGRYGIMNASASGISPNMIFNIIEWWSSWGTIVKKPIIAKLIGSIDVENTEGDTLTLGTTFQIQGANN